MVRACDRQTDRQTDEETDGVVHTEVALQHS